MTEFALRLATLDDAARLLEWRNDPIVRASSFQSKPVEWESHLAWLERKLSSDDCRIWILESGDRAVGQIRYDRENGRAEISFVVAASFRGQGLGTRLLEMSVSLACEALKVEKLVGIVKSGNLASTRAFERAGFQRVENAVRGDETCVMYERDCG